VLAAWSRPVGFGCSALGALILMWRCAPSDLRRRAGYAVIACAFVLAATPAQIACPLFAPVLAMILWPKGRSVWAGLPRSLAIAIAVAIPSIAVVLWWWSARSSIVFYSFLPDWFTRTAPAWAIALFCCAAAAFNATWEELLWRRVLPGTLVLRSALTRAASVIGLSALFGIAHIHSLPGGLPGVLMTAAFAVVAHVVVLALSRGIVAAVFAHFTVDAVLLMLITLGPGYG